MEAENNDGGSEHNDDVDETDFIVCGVCKKEFELNEMSLFIRHKQHQCNPRSAKKTRSTVAGKTILSKHIPCQ